MTFIYDTSYDPFVAWFLSIQVMMTLTLLAELVILALTVMIILNICPGKNSFGALMSIGVGSIVCGKMILTFGNTKFKKLISELHLIAKFLKIISECLKNICAQFQCLGPHFMRSSYRPCSNYTITIKTWKLLGDSCVQ